MNFPKEFLLYYIISGILFIFLLGLFFYVQISNFNLRKLYTQHTKQRLSSNFMVRIYLTSGEIKMFTKGNLNVVQSYKLQDLQKHLNSQHYQTLNDWIVLASAQKLNKNEAISLFLDDAKSLISGWIRLTFERYDANRGRMFIVGQKLLGRERENKAIDTSDFIDLNEFNSLVVNSFSENPGNKGALLIFHLRHLSMYHRRYGREVANQYMLNVWSELIKAGSSQMIISYYFGGNFCVFLKGISLPKAIESFLETIYKQVPHTINISDYSLDVVFKVATTIIASGNELNSILRVLEKSSRLAKDLSLPVSVDLVVPSDNPLTANDSGLEEMMNQIITKSRIATYFYSFVSMQTGITSGYYVTFAADKHTPLPYEELERKAMEIHRLDEFFTMGLRSAILRFSKLRQQPNTLFIAVPTELLESARSFVLSHHDFAAMKVVFVIEDYTQLDNVFRNKSFKEFALSLNDTPIRLAFKSHETMKTTFHPFFEYIQYVVFDTMIKGIEKNQLMQLDTQSILQCFSPTKVQSVALNVTSLAQAQTLREIGITHIGGPVFGQVGKDIESVVYNRIIQKLMDDNEI